MFLYLKGVVYLRVKISNLFSTMVYEKNTHDIGTKKRKNTSFLKNIQIFQNDRRFNRKNIFLPFFRAEKGCKNGMNQVFQKSSCLDSKYVKNIDFLKP